MYEGKWVYGTNRDFANVVYIEDNSENDFTKCNNNIQELIIGRECFLYQPFDVNISNYPELEIISVGENSLCNARSLSICNNEKLHTINIGFDKNSISFSNVESVAIESIYNIVVFITTS